MVKFECIKYTVDVGSNFLIVKQSQEHQVKNN